MSKVAVIGATGYTGTNITRELVARGHEVTAVARDISKLSVEGAIPVAGDVEDERFVNDLIKGKGVIVLAIHHQAHGGRALHEMIRGIAALSYGAGARLAVVGGAGSLRIEEGGPRLFETPQFPDEFKGEATHAFETLKALKTLPAPINWFYLSPAAGYGKHNVGTRRGHYRTGEEVLLKDSQGDSFISGEDFAIAFVDEIENPRHKNQRFTVGY